MKKSKYKTPGFWISALGLLALGTLFILWRMANPDVSPPGRVSALISAGLFAAVCLRFVPEWMKFWKKAPPQERLRSEAERADCSVPAHIGRKIFFSLLAVNLLVILLVFVLRQAAGYGGPFWENLAFWTCTDSMHYLDIARDWYLSEGEWDRLVQLVFLPGYPIAVRLMSYIVGNYLVSGMLVSSLSFAGAGCVLYRLLRLDFSHRDALRTLKYCCILPGAFFFAAPMSESLFLLLCVSCLYCARTGKWTLGCFLGGLAAFTRSLGLTLFVPLLLELIRSIRIGGPIQAKNKLRFFALLLIPAGFAAYCCINYQVAGDPFQFMEYQSVHWGQRFGLFFNTAAYQLERVIGSYSVKPHDALGLWIPNLVGCFASLTVMAFAAKKMRPSYTAWFIAYFFIAIGATWLLSAPRYLIALPSLPMAVSILTRKPKADMAVSLCCIPLYLFYLYAFVMRWQVW